MKKIYFSCLFLIMSLSMAAKSFMESTDTTKLKNEFFVGIKFNGGLNLFVGDNILSHSYNNPLSYSYSGFAGYKNFGFGFDYGSRNLKVLDSKFLGTVYDQPRLSIFDLYMFYVNDVSPKIRLEPRLGIGRIRHEYFGEQIGSSISTGLECHYKLFKNLSIYGGLTYNYINFKRTNAPSDIQDFYQYNHVFYFFIGLCFHSRY